MSKGQEKGLNKDVFLFLLNLSESSRLLLTYELVFAFEVIMASIEECVFQPNNVQFAFSNLSLVNVASALRLKSWPRPCGSCPRPRRVVAL